MRREDKIKKTENITESPEVLVVQYMCFIHYVGDGVCKIDHDIFSQNYLKLNNVMYQLTGIVVHIGETSNSGHYYSVTCCWDTGTTFKLNDSAEIDVVNNNDFDREREKAYMLVFNKKHNEQDAVVNPTERTNNATEADSTNDVSEADSTNDVSEPTTNIEKEMFELLKKKKNILCIKLKDRSKTQTKHLKELDYQLKKHSKIVHSLLNRYPQLKRRQMTAAGRKAASRKRMSQQHMDEVKSSNRDRMFSQRRHLTEDQREEVTRVNRDWRLSH